MLLTNYFDLISEAIEFIMAIGSLIGLFGLLYSAAMWTHTSKKGRGMLISLISASIALIGICGLFTGIKYFRL